MKRPSTIIGETNHLPSRVAAHIVREIKDGRLKSGEKLSGENQLAEQYGVSRNVLREAISQLRADGVIRARQGVGAFVMPPEESKVIRLDPEMAKSRQGMGQLFELRGILETEAAALAAPNMTDKTVSVLRHTLERMSGAERREEGSIDADIAFHAEIAKATGNEYISTFINYIALQTRQSIHLARRTGSEQMVIDPTLAEHNAVIDALAERDAEKARAAMRAHIKGAADRVSTPIDILLFEKD